MIHFCKFLVLLFFWPSPSQAQDETHLFQQIKHDFDKSIVIVECTVSIRQSGALSTLNGGDEYVNEAMGLLVTPDTIICSLTHLTGPASLQNRFLGPLGNHLKIVAQPKDLHVSILGSSQRYQAEILAKDSDLDLIWITIKEKLPPDIKAIPMAAIPMLHLGDRIILSKRMPAFYGHELVCYEGKVGALLNKPRALYVPDFQMDTTFGAPVFDQKGNFIGLTVLQLPGEPATIGESVAALTKTATLSDLMKMVILPLDQINKATTKALALKSERRND